MAEKPRRDIEIAARDGHRQHADAARKVGWTVIGLAILGALAGVFGGGPLSHRSIGSANLHLDYERFARFNCPGKFKIRALNTASPLRLFVNSGLLSRISIERIDPEPFRMELTAGGQFWTFPLAQTNVPVEVVIEYRPSEFGSAAGQIAADGGARLDFAQFYFP